MNSEEFYALHEWYASLEDCENKNGRLLFSIRAKGTQKFNAYIDTISLFPSFRQFDDHIEFSITGVMELARWKDRVSGFIERFRKAKWLPLVTASYGGREFPAGDFHLLSWYLLRNIPEVEKVIYDERLPFPVVSFEKHKPLIVYAKKFGEPFFFCSCAHKAAEKENSPAMFADRICYKCLRIVPKVRYCHPMYGPIFMQHWGWYVQQRCIENGHETPTLDDENETRIELGYPKKGEQWENETHLFYIVKSLFPSATVIQHYRPKWLDGLEIDVWIQEERIGFEYQGIQHYRPVDHWGGEEKLRGQRERDRQKKEICKKAGVALIEVKYSEDVTEDLVIEKIAATLKEDTSLLRETGNQEN